LALVVQGGHLLVRLLRQMAAEAAWVPRGMAGDAIHLLIAVSDGLVVAARDVAVNDLVAGLAFEANRLGEMAGLVVMPVARSDDVLDLHHFPAQVCLDHGVLEQRVAAPLKATLAERRT